MDRWQSPIISRTNVPNEFIIFKIELTRRVNSTASVHCCNPVRCLVRISFDLATEMRTVPSTSPSPTSANWIYIYYPSFVKARVARLLFKRPYELDNSLRTKPTLLNIKGIYIWYVPILYVYVDGSIKMRNAWRGNGRKYFEWAGRRKVGEKLASWNGWKQDSRSYYLGSPGSTCSNS